MAKALVILFLLYSGIAKAQFLIFYPSPYGAKQRQKVFSKATESTVVAKYKDFSNLLTSDDIQIVIAPFDLDKKEMVRIGQLWVSDGSNINVVLLTLDKSLRETNLQHARLGYVQFADKKIEKHKLKKIIGINFKSSKSVTKVEDLISLLVFASVDVIAIPESHLGMLEKSLRDKLFKIGMPIKFPLPSVFAKRGFENKAKKLLKKISKQELNKIGLSKINLEEK